MNESESIVVKVETDKAQRKAVKRQGGINDTRRTIGATALTVEDLNRKVDVQHREIMQIFSFLGDIETRLEAMRALAIRGGIFTEADYDRTWDEIKGLRVKGPDELMAKGDFATLNYRVTDDTDGKELAADKNFPVRLGLGALMFEDQMLGQPVGAWADHTFKHTYPDAYDPNPALSGKTVTFWVSVARVKCKQAGTADE